MINKAASPEPRVRFRSFFEPDVLTAHGFFNVYRQKGQWGPEERLMFAVLTDAVECFQKHLGAQNRRSRLLFSEAAEWIQARDASWPFSFEQICQTLDINSSYLRVGLSRWRSLYEKKAARTQADTRAATLPVSCETKPNQCFSFSHALTKI